MSATKTIADLREALASRDGELAALRGKAKQHDECAHVLYEEVIECDTEVDTAAKIAQTFFALRKEAQDALARVSALEAALGEAREVLVHARNEMYKLRGQYLELGDRVKQIYWHEESSRYADAIDALDAARAGGQG